MADSNSAKLAALTSKMEAYAQGIADGLNKSDAYRAAYDCANMLAKTVHESASRLAADPRVSARIKALQTQTADALATRREWDRDRLVGEAEVNLHQARNARQFAPANKAVEIIARLTGNLDGPVTDTNIRITKVTVVLPPGDDDTVVDADGYEVMDDPEVLNL